MPECLSSNRVNPVPWMLAALVVAVGLAYANGLNGTWHWDGVVQVEHNPKLAEIPSMGEVVGSARGVGELTFRLNGVVNVWLGREAADPLGFLLVNVAIHLGAVLLVFGIARRTLGRPVFGPKVREHAAAIGFVIALLWAVHPLNTQAVVYIVQRYESLMGLCLLAAVYSHVRAHDARDAGRQVAWHAATLLAIVVGFRVKQVIVVTPVLLLAWDWVFVRRAEAGDVSRRAVWRAWYAVVGLMVLVGAVLAARQALRAGGSAGLFAVESTRYALAQPGVVLHYLRLVVWPDPLVFHYLWLPPQLRAQDAAYIATTAVPVLLLAGLTGWMLWRRHWTGFVGAWFFVILAPTSSVIAITDVCVEHRMYLPGIAVLAAMVGGAVAGLFLLMGRSDKAAETGPRMALLGAVVVALLLGVRTYIRNVDYSTYTSIWLANIRDHPQGPEGYLMLAITYDRHGELDMAVDAYQVAAAMRPEHAASQFALGFALRRRYLATGNREDLKGAVEALHKAAESRPEDAEYQRVFTVALAEAGLWGGAVPRLEKRVAAGLAETSEVFYLATGYAATGRLAEAVATLDEAIGRDPEDVRFHALRGQVLADLGRTEEAEAALRRALEIDPDAMRALQSLGGLLLKSGRADEAIEPLTRAIRTSPGQLRSFFMLRQACAAVDPPRDPVAIYVAAGSGHAGFARATGQLVAALRQAKQPELRDPAMADRLAAELERVRGPVPMP